jgi:hypothetical protein
LHVSSIAFPRLDGFKLSRASKTPGHGPLSKRKNAKKAVAKPEGSSVLDARRVRRIRGGAAAAGRSGGRRQVGSGSLGDPLNLTIKHYRLADLKS